MKKSFYHFILKYRDERNDKKLKLLADQIYWDHSFPKQSSNYHEISMYLEMNGHFLDAVSTFDRAWQIYETEEN